jgi:hypothetical protein
MPAYRSSAEAEVRDAAIARLRAIRPASRIIHEINVSGQGSNRIDLIAVGEAEIIAVEVKSAKDKLDRLPAQVQAMRGVAHHSIVAMHEKFLIESETNRFAAHCERDGKFFRSDVPKIANDASVWVYLETKRAIGEYDGYFPWPGAPYAAQTSLPSGALWMLWRDEMYELCSKLRINVSRRSTMTDMSRDLRWLANGGELTKGICAALRARQCIEADPVSEAMGA